jgi:hypothetical protein
MRQRVLGESNESFGFGQENLPQLQDHPAQGRGARDLHGSASQAAPRLIARVLEDEMARIAGINIPPQQHSEIGLTAIFGIGRTRARKICEACGIAYSKKIKDLTDASWKRFATRSAVHHRR